MRVVLVLALMTLTFPVAAQKRGLGAVLGGTLGAAVGQATGKQVTSSTKLSEEHLPKVASIVNKQLPMTGPRAAMRQHIFSDLPSILSYVTDGTYSRAIQSEENMKDFVDHLTGEFDRAANMDW